MYYVLKILYESKEIIPAKDIQSILEDQYDLHLDVKTVRAIISYINEFFLEFLNGQMIMTVHKRGYYIDKTILSNAQVQFIIDAIVSHNDLNYEDKLNLTNHILSLVPFYKQDQLLVPELEEEPQSFSILQNIQNLQKAIQENKMIVFNYITYDIKDNHLTEINSKGGNEVNNPYSYLVSPYKIINTNNHYYLIAYNTKYQKLVNYRVDRMRRIMIKRRVRYDFPEDIDLENEIKKTINMFSISSNVCTLELEVNSQSSLREVVSRFGNHLPAVKSYKGSYLVTIEDIQINDGLKGWLMMMGDQVKVTAPTSLVETIKEDLLKMLKTY